MKMLWLYHNGGPGGREFRLAFTARSRADVEPFPRHRWKATVGGQDVYLSLRPCELIWAPINMRRSMVAVTPGPQHYDVSGFVAEVFADSCFKLPWPTERGPQP